ncbi:TPA: type 2 lanthipeptide synthetase LanM family protein [Streptococcus agalactiae]
MKKSYFSERIYNKEEYTIDLEVISYWKEILKGVSLEDIEEAYDLNINEILFNKNFKESSSYYNLELENEIINSNNKNNKYILAFLNEKQIVFSNFFFPIINIGIKRLIENDLPYINDSVILNYIEVLLEKIGKVSLGVLIFELYILKKESKLIGNNPDEEYNYYNDKFLQNKDYKNEIFKIYPCLLRSITEIVDSLSSNYSEMLNNLKFDYDLIKNELCNNLPFTTIKNIQSNISDSHNKGYSVSIIELDNNIKIVYKPHSLEVEDAYNKFTEIFSCVCKYSLYQLKAIDRGNYGWEEYIECSPCNTIEEVSRYYYRFGALIFINYILNTNDLHVENVIASGQYPIIIDLETILNNSRTIKNNSAKGKINAKLNNSVLYSGLLPQKKYLNLGKGIDISAIKGKANEKYPIRIPVLKDIFTSNIRFDYEFPISKENHNLVSYKNEFANPHDYLKDINEGFSDLYKFVLKNKDVCLNALKLFENLKVRYLVQDTQKYAMILHTSLHPDFMQDGKDRELFLCNLFKDYRSIQGDLNTVKYEIKDLLNLDIPYFQLNTSKTSLYSSCGEEIKNYFDISSIEKSRNKISCLSEKDLSQQIRLINIMLMDLDKHYLEGKKRTYNKFLKSSKIKEATVFKIADYLFESAFFNDDKSEVNWVGANIIGDEDDYSWNIGPLGTYLYEGISGILIFFRSLYKYTNDEKYKIICKAIDKEMFNYTDEMLSRNDDLSNESSGIFSGEASIVYTYEILYSITKEKIYLDYAKKHITVLQKAMLNDSNHDLMYGNSGALLSLLNMYEITNDKFYIEQAIDVGKNLVNVQNDNGSWTTSFISPPLAGFSHGTSGIILSLSKLWKVTRDKDLLDSIKNGLVFENSLYDIEHMNWKDERIHDNKKISEDDIFTNTWCHGAAGILLSRLKMRTYMGDEIFENIKDDISLGLISLLSENVMESNCLCHGNLGNTEIIMEYSRETKNLKLKEYVNFARKNLAYDMNNNILDYGNKYLSGTKLPGFMTGLSGMGYSLLRDLDESLPCILALEI